MAKHNFSPGWTTRLIIDGEEKPQLTYSNFADIKLYRMAAAGDADACAIKNILENPDDEERNASLAILGDPVKLIDRLFNRRGYMLSGTSLQYEFFKPSSNKT